MRIAKAVIPSSRASPETSTFPSTTLPVTIFMSPSLYLEQNILESGEKALHHRERTLKLTLYLTNKWIREHETSKAEVSGLLAIADRDIAQNQLPPAKRVV